MRAPSPPRWLQPRRRVRPAHDERNRKLSEVRVTQAAIRKTALPPPVAPRRPHSFTVHGITVTDDYAWLKDENWQEVLRDPALLKPDIRAYLEAENTYTDSLLGHTEGLQKLLVKEMRGRIKEDDSS